MTVLGRCLVCCVVALAVCTMKTTTNATATTSSSSTTTTTTATSPTITTPPMSSKQIVTTTTTSNFLPQKYSLEGGGGGGGALQNSPRRFSKDTLHTVSSLFAGVGSGALASVFCAPLDVLRTRMQVWGDVAKGSKAGWQVLQDILQNEGWRGGFRGLGATLITVPVFWGLYFPLYDSLKKKLAAEGRNPSLVHCGSAILAGAVADVLCNPMFVVRTRLQTEGLHSSSARGIVQTVTSLYQQGGLPIFWRGMTASLMGLSHVAVQFPIYEWLKLHARLKSTEGKESPFDLLLASGLSKMCASLLTYPHEVVRSRMMDHRGTVGTTLGATIHRILQHEGYMGFYSGLQVSLLRVVPNCCITFMTYELLLRFAREELERRNENNNTNR